MRIARCSVPGVLTHVISRFVDRSWQLQSDQERRKYLDLFGRAIVKTDWKCVSYALMSSHLHVGLLAGEMPLESWAKRVNSPFARWLNIRHDRLGPVMADRPSEWVMNPLNETRLIAYIHNNPVRAKVVPRAADSTWSSHRAYLGLAPRPAWLHVEAGLAICGFGRDQPELFDEWIDRTVGIDLKIPSLREVRVEARRRGAIEIGSPVLSTTTTEVPLVIRPGGTIRPSLRDVIALVADVTGCDMNAICSRTARPRAVSARRVAIHAAHRMGLTFGEIASALGISPQATGRHFDAPLTATQTVEVNATMRRGNRELGWYSR